MKRALLSKNKMKNTNSKKIISLFESFILVISIIAFAYFIGEEFRVVSAIPGDVKAALTAGGNTAKTGLETSKMLSSLKELFNKNNFVQAGIVAVGVYAFFRVVTGDKDKAKFAAQGVGVYYGAKTATGWLSTAASKLGMTETAKMLGTLTPYIAIGAVIIYALMYKKTETKQVIFQCRPYEADRGGKNCEKCNKQGAIPCTEYQCKSLGLSCELVNKGTKDEKCVYADRKDTKFPIITPWKNILMADYDYTEISATGTKIIDTKTTSKCLKANIPFTFGVMTNELSKCKISTERTKTFDEMLVWDDNYYYNHTYVLKLFSPDVINAEDPSLKNDGNYELFVRCKDTSSNGPNGQGNYNLAEFVFKFCVEKGPDGEVPKIYGTDFDIFEKPYVAYNKSSVNTYLYMNEPAQCKWSKENKDYDKMENTMTDCQKKISDMNSDMTFSCKTTLTGIKDRAENKFYFRCKDNSGNTNQESHEFTLYGSQPLIIDAFKPANNETIKDSTPSVKVTFEVETSAGANEGNAICGLSDDNKKFVDFANTNSNTHEQILNLPTGKYKYYLRCIDAGGNTKTIESSFNVESDNKAPEIVRIYNDNNELKLVTNEESGCVYSTSSCSYLFGDGIKITTENDIEHTMNWNTNSNYYIKCEDSYGNQPLPNQCSIIARPFSV